MDCPSLLVLFTLCLNINLFFSQRLARDCQFNSLNISFVAVSYGLPVMILAVLFCIFCNYRRFIKNKHYKNLQKWLPLKNLPNLVCSDARFVPSLYNYIIHTQTKLFKLQIFLLFLSEFCSNTMYIVEKSIVLSFLNNTSMRICKYCYVN